MNAIFQGEYYFNVKKV